jgi:FtsP/CotA-like multicopper oxidase with cupredoxin domain
MRLMPLIGLAVAGALACVPEAAPLPVGGAQPAGFDDDIKIQEAEDTDPDPGVVRVTLEARVVPLEITPGVFTEVWTYNGQLPGPTLRAKKGDRVVVTFKNALPEPTTVHWHGVRVIAAMDGTEMMQAPVEPGGEFVYDFEIKDAGTYWYHPHINSSAQVGYGLYGALVVTDDSEPPLGDDVVLVLSDMGLDDDGQLLPGDHQGWFGDYFGRQGSLNLVNGKLMPTLKARVGVPQRWRVVNASRAKYNRLKIEGHDFTLVGVDGGLIEEPVPDAEVVLPPGARAEVVFVPRAGGEARFEVTDLGVDHFHLSTAPQQWPLWTLEVTDDAPVRAPRIPPTLRTIAAPDEHGGAHPQQSVTLDVVVAADGNSYFGINGALHPDGEDFHAHTNSIEEWTLLNNTNQDHPFHLHGFFFQVLEIGGRAPPLRGWFDTVNLEPQVPVRIAIVFDERAGSWMFHCHILDHTDTGMMRMLMVEEPTE